MENLSLSGCCILRHCSPFRQGVSQSSAALWECWNTAVTLPVLLTRGVLGLSLSVLVSSPYVWDDLLTVKGQRPSVFVPVLSPDTWAPLPLPSVPSCLILLAALSLSPSVWSKPWARLGLLLSWPPPHCVLPEASARTRCRLMASSKNPATFSLSSYTEQIKECLGKKKD